MVKNIKLLRILQALALGGVTVFSLWFSHITFTQTSMSGMESLSDHTASSVECQILCSTAAKANEHGGLSELKNEAKDPLPIVRLLGSVSLALLTVTFVVKFLHFLSSWRPPDRILLYGRYADGL